MTTQQMPKSLSDAITKSKSEEIHTMIQAIENEVGRDLNGMPLKDVQDAVKALIHEIKSQKSDGMSPKQLGEGFKETVERYKGMIGSLPYDMRIGVYAMDGKEKSVFEKIISGVDRNMTPKNVKKTMRSISNTGYQPKCVLKPLPDCVLIQRGERK